MIRAQVLGSNKPSPLTSVGYNREEGPEQTTRLRTKALWAEEGAELWNSATFPGRQERQARTFCKIIRGKQSLENNKELVL